MHFEILVEDTSGKIALESIVKKILGPNGQDHTYRFYSYKGIGRIPKNLKGKTDPKKRILLDQLPRILRGYGKSLKSFPAVVVVVVDLDQKDCKNFKHELLSILNTIHPAPKTLFRIAIEEIEAWYLGDREALLTPNPGAKTRVLNNYVQDSICGTWEILADDIFPGGSTALIKAGWPKQGLMKCEWVKRIAPNMDVENNDSPSFQIFRDGLLRLAR